MRNLSKDCTNTLLRCARLLSICDSRLVSSYLSHLLCQALYLAASALFKLLYFWTTRLQH